jgi:hypothetical protein
MDLRRLRLGEWVAAVGGVGLAASLFLPWYEPTVGVDLEHDIGPELTGFESFSVLDLYLVIVALLPLALALLQATRRSPTLPVGAAVLTVLVGAVATLLVSYRIVNQPGPNEFVEVRPWAWLGLLATVAIAVGGWESLRNEHVRGAETGPEPELRPAPDA